ncbi:MAG: hypothetical protein M3256_22370 [Actinomycetota bacterium]|nr:hypothetical protein [Actinomycetota bacterium]
MFASTSVAVVLVGDPMKTETIAVAGFLAGDCGSTRRSYATHLRLFAAWCHEANLSLFSVRRSHIELFVGGWRRRVHALHRGPAAVHPGQLL